MTIMRTPSFARQRGVSLISLMIGLVISMIVVVGALALFQNTAKRTATARQDVLSDAQRTSSFLSAGLSLQDAGFGITTPTAGTHLVWLRNATISGTTLSGTAISAGTALTAGVPYALIWAENITGTVRCSGILAPLTGGLRKLGPVNCTNAAAWSSLAWTNSLLSDTPATPVTIRLETVNCQPFGITTNEGTLRVTFSANNSNGVALSASQCLINFSA